ncbi:TRAP transporter small permease subunit, partial [Mycobacterium tuberculosis]|nr:TRAP transporter small permease subunit [Mycobacterium tuberculosis]
MQSEASMSAAPAAPLIGRAHAHLAALVRIVMAGLLGVMSVLIIYQVVARYVFNAPSSLTEELLRYSLIWLGILGAGYCFMLNKHLNLPLLVDAVSAPNAMRLH